MGTLICGTLRLLGGSTRFGWVSSSTDGVRSVTKTIPWCHNFFWLFSWLNYLIYLRNLVRLFTFIFIKILDNTIITSLSSWSCKLSNVFVNRSFYFRGLKHYPCKCYFCKTLLGLRYTKDLLLNLFLYIVFCIPFTWKDFDENNILTWVVCRKVF